MRLRRRAAVLLLLLGGLAGPASVSAQPPEWTRPSAPFRIAGNLYYVGSADLASYLIVTPAGSILINSNLASSPPQIQASIEALGLRMSDIRILLISHAHYDHCAGSRAILERTGAKYLVAAPDVSVVESGGRTDFQYGSDPAMRFAPAHVDRALGDGETVRLGGMALTAHLTPGHTRGTTTWTFDEREGGRTLHVVIVGSPNVNPGYRLVGNRVYPEIADDYRRGLRVLKGLPCDIFLGAHGGYFGLTERYARLRRGDRSAFVDPEGYRRYVEERERAFERELDRQLRESRPRGTPRPAPVKSS